MTKANPDCTGQKFGLLTVLGKGERRFFPNSGYTVQMWRVLCDCGTIVQLRRGDFEPSPRCNRRQISCGCYKKAGFDNKRRPTDISGQRFGQLTAIALTEKKDKYNQPTWFLQCDCGNMRTHSLKILNHKQKHCLWVNCANKSRHPERWLHYPPTPTPYPKEAGELLIKYLHLTKSHYTKIDSAVEDEKRDRLIRAAWIITYRRNQGEIFSEAREMRFIKKHLRYSSIKVFWQRKVEEHGGLLYSSSGIKKQIGDKMTDVTFSDYPVLETQGKTMLRNHKLKFKRC